MCTRVESSSSLAFFLVRSKDGTGANEDGLSRGWLCLKMDPLGADLEASHCSEKAVVRKASRAT